MLERNDEALHTLRLLEKRQQTPILKQVKNTIFCSARKYTQKCFRRNETYIFECAMSCTNGISGLFRASSGSGCVFKKERPVQKLACFLHLISDISIFAEKSCLGHLQIASCCSIVGTPSQGLATMEALKMARSCVVVCQRKRVSYLFETRLMLRSVGSKKMEIEQ